MRQAHRAGEKHSVDLSGPRLHLVGPKTGEEIAVDLFVGVLGADFAEATRGQDLSSSL